MERTAEKLETLFAAVRELPEAEQLAAVEALSDIANAPYQLSEDELTILRPALNRARREEFADEAMMAELLEQSWQKTAPKSR